jgi:hypothetical protein
VYYRCVVFVLCSIDGFLFSFFRVHVPVPSPDKFKISLVRATRARALQPCVSLTQSNARRTHRVTLPGPNPATSQASAPRQCFTTNFLYVHSPIQCLLKYLNATREQTEFQPGRDVQANERNTRQGKCRFGMKLNKTKCNAIRRVRCAGGVQRKGIKRSL